MVKKKLSSNKNWKETLWETVSWCVTSTNWVTPVFRGAVCYPYCCGIWELIFRIPWRLKGQGNILWSKWERSYLRNFVVICEFISQSYSFSRKKPFAKTVLEEFAEWYLEAHGGLRWKGKYPQIKTGKKLSENLLCNVLLPLTELKLYVIELFVSLITVVSENWYFGSFWRL